MASENLEDGAGQHGKFVVALELSGTRELHWVSPDSAIAGWRAGDAVVFRNAGWRVTGRTETGESMRLTLAPVD